MRGARHPRNSTLPYRDSPKDQEISQKPTEPLRLDDVVFVAHRRHRVCVCVLSACVSPCANRRSLFDVSLLMSR